MYIFYHLDSTNAEFSEELLFFFRKRIIEEYPNEKHEGLLSPYSLYPLWQCRNEELLVFYLSPATHAKYINFVENGH